MSTTRAPATFLPVAAAVGLVAAILAGCYRPGGAIMPYTGGAQTYWSSEMLPKTVLLVDVRTGDVVFSMDIPPGKQLSMDFVEGAGDDPVFSPDLMRYEIFDIGTTTGKLRSAMSVPTASSRRVDIEIRKGVEYTAAAADRDLRTDQPGDRPDWWTTQGGTLPEDPHGLTIYDR